MAFNKEQFIEDIKVMSVLELNELVKAIEEEFGVSAAAPVAVAAAGEVADAADAKQTVTLVAAGGSKMKVIQELRKICPELSLPEAKGLADNGGAVKEGIAADDAKEIVERLEALGATVEAK